MASAREERDRILAETGAERRRAEAEAGAARLRAELVDVTATAELQGVGLFDYDHPAESSAELASRLEALRYTITNAVRDKRAVTAASGFTFDGSESQGRRFVSDMSKVLLRAHYAATLAALEANGDVEGAARMRDRIHDVDRALVDVDHRAANVRAGYVSVISNVGAFGERMVKIGMTRRLEPMDRVVELGDASVPFRFDVHALFFADDAVGVEAMLHRTFAEQRVNRINLRREFFCVTPDEVLDALRAHAVEIVEFAVLPAAEECRASRALDGAEPVPAA